MGKRGLYWLPWDLSSCIFFFFKRIRQFLRTLQYMWSSSRHTCKCQTFLFALRSIKANCCSLLFCIWKVKAIDHKIQQTIFHMFLLLHMLKRKGLLLLCLRLIDVQMDSVRYTYVFGHPIYEAPTSTWTSTFFPLFFLASMLCGHIN